ncbi:MAG: hypothetical protein ACI9NN_001745, partial [Bacteroidia bacterium]
FVFLDFLTRTPSNEEKQSNGYPKTGYVRIFHSSKLRKPLMVILEPC